MNGTPSVLGLVSSLISAMSGVFGCVIGMAFMTWYARRSGPPAATASLSQLEANPEHAGSPSRVELESILGSLCQINSQIDSRVGQHTVRVGEINDSLENGSPDDRELLVRAAKLLVSANHQLQSDLAAAETQLLNQRELAESFRHESRTDALTQLLNRRAFEDELNSHLAKVNRENHVFSLLFIDIDHFKRINDQHGHLNGDQVLLTVAQCLKSNLHPPASVSRYGGEEFAVVLPEVSGKNAVKVAERLRKAIEQCPHCLEGTSLTVTVSIGIAQAFSEDTRSELIERSDHALFAAKNGGRNQCFHNQRKTCTPSLSATSASEAQTSAAMRA